MRKQFGVLLVAAYAACAQTASTVTFDAASLKPAAQQPSDANGRNSGCSGGTGTTSPGQWVCVDTGLAQLIIIAFQLQRYQYTFPDWMYASHFDLIAKVPRDTTIEQLHRMQQDLLITRFKLSFHFDDKEMQGYDLVVGKGGPKFQESVDDPPDYTPPPKPKTMDWDRRDGFPILPAGHETVQWMLNGRVSNRWRKITIEELARYISSQSGRPVSDLTHLSGKYDITLRFIATPMPLPGSPVEVDANGQRIPQVLETRPTLTEAVQSQLGLLLESKKTVAKIFTIDHVEKVPIEN